MAREAAGQEGGPATLQHCQLPKSLPKQGRLCMQASALQAAAVETDEELLARAETERSVMCSAGPRDIVDTNRSERAPQGCPRPRPQLDGA